MQTRSAFALTAGVGGAFCNSWRIERHAQRTSISQMTNPLTGRYNYGQDRWWARLQIEGHLRIEAELERGKIKDAWSSSTMFRGIEKV